MSEVLEWRKHDSQSEICPTEFGPYMVEDTGGEVWAWLPDQQQQARRRVNSSSVKDAKDLCQEDVDTRRALRDCAPYLAKGETPAQRIEREFNDSQFLLGRLASSQAEIERLRAALDLLVAEHIKRDGCGEPLGSSEQSDAINGALAALSAQGAQS
jgi:hypothetical protein